MSGPSRRNSLPSAAQVHVTRVICGLCTVIYIIGKCLVVHMKVYEVEGITQTMENQIESPLHGRV